MENIKNENVTVKDVQELMTGEKYVPIRRFFHECKTEEERQKLRDHYLETVYHQTIIQNTTLSKIQEQLSDIRRHMDYLAMSEDTRKYINEDKTMNFEAIAELLGQVEKEIANGRTEM